MEHQEKSKVVIKFVDDQPKENVGSLLKLFSSPYFTLDMCLTYLYKKRKELGVHDFLVNKLYTYKDYEIDFYVPQLCYSLIKTGSQALERFLLDKCLINTTLFLKIFWCLKAYGQAERKTRRYDYVEMLITKVEMAMVNGVTNKNQSDLIRSISKGVELTEEMIEAMKTEAERKKNRAEYLSETLRFINILVSISLRLKSQKIEDRKPMLKSYIRRINRWLKHMRKKHVDEKDEYRFIIHEFMTSYFRKLFHGIHMPFTSLFKSDPSTQIVRILDDEVACFNTKKRAPYKIVVETVDMEEVGQLELSKMKSKDDRISDITFPDSQEEDNWEDILAEQQNWEKTPTEGKLEKMKSKQEQYNALADFNKLLREEEAKLKDTQLLKEVDLAQKLQIMGKPIHPGSQRVSLDEKEQLKHIEERKSNHVSHSHPHFDIKNPSDGTRPAPSLTRRHSLETWPRSPEPIAKRRFSLRNINDEETIKKIENLKISSLPQSVHSKADAVINQLKEKINTKQVPAKKKKKRSKSPQDVRPQLTGWGPWEELWEFKKESIKEKSPFGHFKSYKLRCLIVKAADDLRQELLAMQLIRKIEQIWKDAGLKLYLRTYDILVTSDDSGVLEFVPDTYSLDGLKKKYPGFSLKKFFLETYGFNFEEAQKNFMDSLSAYSIICYLLQIKDRHNGNILLDAHGHIVHIDFGFLFTTSPGGINFESAPFKLTHEYVELLEGIQSNTFTYFKMQLTKGFMELRKHVDEFVSIIQVMLEGTDLPCFENFDMSTFRERFKENSTDLEMINFQKAWEHIEKLIDISYDNWRTIQYDNFQKYTNGIIP